MLTLEQYRQASIEHRGAHKCGGFPYANGNFLQALPKKLNATNALEIGTAIGYSAYCLASSNDDMFVTTIDLNPDHEELAKGYWLDLGVSKKIKMLIGQSIDVLPMLNEQFDIIFFDGFAPDPLECSHYARLIKDYGVIVTTNLTWNKTTPQYLQNLNDLGIQTREYYDTSVSSKNVESIKMACEVWESLI